jgi:predicted nucleotidyltransferase
MAKDYRRIAEDFARHLKAAYGARIDRVILFGSVARGDSREDSDVDLLVVTPERDLSLQWDVARDATDLLVREGVLASVLVVTTEQWGRARHTLFGRRVASEGLALA